MDQDGILAASSWVWAVGSKQLLILFQCPHNRLPDASIGGKNNFGIIALSKRLLLMNSQYSSTELEEGPGLKQGLIKHMISIKTLAYDRSS